MISSLWIHMCMCCWSATLLKIHLINLFHLATNLLISHQKCWQRIIFLLCIFCWLLICMCWICMCLAADLILVTTYTYCGWTIFTCHWLGAAEHFLVNYPTCPHPCLVSTCVNFIVCFFRVVCWTVICWWKLCLHRYVIISSVFQKCFFTLFDVNREIYPVLGSNI